MHWILLTDSTSSNLRGVSSGLMSWILSVTFLLLPAIKNGFPLVMGDTFRYLHEAEGQYSWVTSQFYGHFLSLFQGTSLWLVVLVQAIILTYVLRTLIKYFFGWGNIRTTLFVVALSLSSTAGFFASLIMTDVMFGTALVAAGVLVTREVSRPDALGLASVVAFGGMVHPAAMPALALIAVVSFVVINVRARSTNAEVSHRSAMAIGAALVVTLFGLSINNAVIWDKASPNAHSSVVMFAYLLTHGDLTDELDSCDELAVCSVAFEFGPGINGFNTLLFAPRSPIALELGGAHEFAEDAQVIALRHIREDPAEYFERIRMSGTAQLTMVRADSHVAWMAPRLADHHVESVARFSTNDAHRFETSLEYANELDLRLSSWLSAFMAAVGGLVALLGMTGLLLIRGFRIPSADPRRIKLAMLSSGTLLAYVGHAYLVATTTYPAERYGGRVSWLLVMGLWIWIFGLTDRRLPADS